MDYHGIRPLRDHALVARRVLNRATSRKRRRKEMSTTMVASEANAVPPVVSSIQDFRLDKIHESKTSPRSQFDHAKLAERAGFVPRNKSRVYVAFWLMWPRCVGSAVQPEMERGRSPLVNIPPFGRGFSRYRYDHPAIPQHGCVPAEPASVSPGQIIVAPPHPSVSTSG
jgi:hypothetical protein